jgi:hypothetical protein
MISGIPSDVIWWTLPFIMLMAGFLAASDLRPAERLSTLAPTTIDGIVSHNPL